MSDSNQKMNEEQKNRIEKEREAVLKLKTGLKAGPTIIRPIRLIGPGPIALYAVFCW